MPPYRNFSIRPLLNIWIRNSIWIKLLKCFCFLFFISIMLLMLLLIVILLLLKYLYLYPYTFRSAVSNENYRIISFYQLTDYGRKKNVTTTSTTIKSPQKAIQLKNSHLPKQMNTFMIGMSQCSFCMKMPVKQEKHHMIFLKALYCKVRKI